MSDIVLQETIKWIPSQEKITAAKLQRKFLIDYPTAARVLVELQHQNLITDEEQTVGVYRVISGKPTPLAVDGALCTCVHPGQLKDNICQNCGLPFFRPATKA